MSKCLCVHVSVCLYVYVSMCLCVYASMCLCVFAPIHLCAHGAHVYVFVSRYHMFMHNMSYAHMIHVHTRHMAKEMKCFVLGRD